MKPILTLPQGADAAGIAAGARTPAAARALLALLLAPLRALLEQSVARLFTRLDTLLEQFRAGTLLAPTPARTLPLRPHSRCAKPQAAAESWLARLLDLAAQDEQAATRPRQPHSGEPRPIQPPLANPDPAGRLRRRTAHPAPPPNPHPRQVAPSPILGRAIPRCGQTAAPSGNNFQNTTPTALPNCAYIVTLS